MRFLTCLTAALAALVASGCATSPPPQTAGGYDLVIRGGTVYDGSGGNPFAADIGIRGDRIATIGDLSKAHARENSRRARAWPSRRASSMCCRGRPIR